jgi:hypothetical protein
MAYCPKIVQFKPIFLQNGGFKVISLQFQQNSLSQMAADRTDFIKAAKTLVLLCGHDHLAMPKWSNFRGGGKYQAQNGRIFLIIPDNSRFALVIFISRKSCSSDFDYIFRFLTN